MMYDKKTQDRFWSKVSIGSESECWLWTAATNESGYGRFKIKRNVHKAHRVAWEIANGEPAGDAFIMHDCDTPGCCNPNHLRRGTARDNMFDMVRKGRCRAPNMKLTVEDVTQIKWLLRKGVPNWALAADFGVSTPTISKIKYGKSWAHVTPEPNQNFIGAKDMPRKLTGDLVLHLRKRMMEGERVCDLAREIGLPYTTIHSLRERRRWPNHWPDRKRRLMTRSTS